MPTNVFISFTHENLKQVESIRALAKNAEHELEFHDRSELEPVKDKVGTPLPYQPDDPRAKPIMKELKRLLRKATKMVVVIGEATHRSSWVNWEIQTFYDQKSNLSGDATKRVKGMYVKECHFYIWVTRDRVRWSREFGTWELAPPQAEGRVIVR